MTGRGRPPKQPDQRAPGNESRYAALAPIEEMPDVDEQGRALVPSADGKLTPVVAPPLPEHVGAYGAEAWARVWRSGLVAVWGDSDYESLARWVQLVDLRNTVYGELMKEGLTITGASGTQITNPKFRQQREISAEVMKLEDLLGMTPLGRLRLGLMFVQARAIERDLKGDAAVAGTRTPSLVGRDS